MASRMQYCGGDRVLRRGRPFGRIHCWTGGGASVFQLNVRTPITVVVDGVELECDHVVITDEMFRSGEFTTEPWQKEHEGYCEHCGAGPICMVCGRGLSLEQKRALQPA